MKERQENRNSTALWLSRQVGTAWWEIGALAALEVALALASLGQAWLLKDLVNAAAAGDGNGFRTPALLFVLVILLQLSLQALVRYGREHCRATLENRLKDSLFETLLTRDYARVTAVHSEEWMNRMVSDSVLVANGLTDILPEVCGMSVRLIGALWMAFALMRGVSWLILPVGVLLAVLAFLFRKKLKEMQKTVRAADGRLRIFLSERLSGQLLVRSFAQEEASLELAGALMAEHLDTRLRRTVFANYCRIGLGILMRGLYAGAVLYCCAGMLQGTLDYGVFAAVVHLMGQIQAPFANLSGFLPQYYAMLAGADRLMEAEALPAEDPDRRTEEEIAAFYREQFRALRFETVDFTYPEETDGGRPSVLVNVSFTLEKGGILAVTGPSGCGKSTLLKLMMCLYTPDSGRRVLVTASGECELTGAWRTLFAYVPQGNQMMYGTVREVLSFGDLSVSEDRLREALSIACAETFVAELPDGLDTALGERGAGLSEGQLQRLAIARALVSGRPILLLDEATASLDEETERRVLENIRSLTDRTTVLVTHRPQGLAVCTGRLKLGETPDGL